MIFISEIHQNQVVVSNASLNNPAKVDIKKCAAFNCSNNDEKYRNLSFFRFPKNVARLVNVSVNRLSLFPSLFPCDYIQSVLRFLNIHCRCMLWVTKTRRTDFIGKTPDYMYNNHFLCPGTVPNHYWYPQLFCMSILECMLLIN